MKKRIGYSPFLPLMSGIFTQEVPLVGERLKNKENMEVEMVKSELKHRAS